ncbi:MAG: iron-sulfur cluster repair di-iron protein [Bacteroidales bacterium]|nr:iron-sulfur cluster repair di-iron protein [Bacteroidales bacterium]
MENNSFDNNTIGQIVTNDFRAAEIFKKAGIDFCCGGNQSIADACNEKGIDPEVIVSELAVLAEQDTGRGNNFNAWDLDFLCDFIVNTHHSYVRKKLPELIFYTQKIASVHGDSHPELHEVQELFEGINKELSQHMQKEEEVLFPAIKQALKETDENVYQIIRSEISRMSDEHEFAGTSMDKIRSLTRNYSVPEDACNTYLVALKTLEQFEDDLHIHVHLENNILFPKALAKTDIK